MSNAEDLSIFAADKTLALFGFNAMIKMKFLVKHCLIVCFLFSTNFFAQTNISGTINTYTPVQAINTSNCVSTIQVLSSSGFSTNDKVLIIQMQGGIIDLTNSSSYGSVTNYLDVGNYEFARITAITGNLITLNTLLQRSYTTTDAVQLIRVPEYVNANVTGTLTAQTWNGTTGGVLAFEVSQTLTLNANIDVSNLAFVPGQSNYNAGYSCGETGYFFNNTSLMGVDKGEGIYKCPITMTRGRGAAANAGGGGNNHNTGGGGGSNGGAGGKGGDEWSGCNPVAPVGGIGGYALLYNNTANKIFMGGGGGAGHNNLANVNTLGGIGAGIVIIKATTIDGNNYDIRANGQNAPYISLPHQEGRGGGGAGGTVLLDVQNYSSAITVEATGGNGGNLNNSGAGPGGGAGGGVVWFSNNALPLNVTTDVNGGSAGFTSIPDNYGSTPGQSGLTLFDLSMVETTGLPTLFLGNDTTICQGSSFSLDATTPNNSGYLWQDNSSLSTFTVTTSGTYWVTVSFNGCNISDTIQITVLPSSTSVLNPSICQGNLYSLPSGSIVNATGTYYDTLNATSGCDSIITINLTVINASTSSSNPSICFGQNYTLPGGAIVSNSGTYVDTLVSAVGCDSIITTNLSIVNQITSSISPSICNGQSYTLPGGNIVNTTGVYIDTLLSTGGCDSIITTNLTIGNNYQQTQSPSICNGQNFTLPGGSNVTAGGTYYDTLLTVDGCDSIITTTLSILPTSSFIQNPVICSGNNFTLPDGSIVNSSGNYIDTLTANNGCDSTISTILTVLPNSTSTQNPVICIGDNYTLPNGNIVSLTGTYVSILTASNGCDSVITTNLNVVPAIINSLNPVICIGQTYTLPNGSIVSSSGTYSDTLLSTGGCDSIINTNLSVVPAILNSVNPTICVGQNYTLPNGNVVSNSGIYIDTLLSSSGCDSIITTTLSVVTNIQVNVSPSICDGQSYNLPSGIQVNVTGIYIDTLVSVGGCDSIITTSLTVNNLPVSSTNNDTTIILGQTISLSASGGGTYFWFPPTGLNTTSGNSVLATPGQTTTYCVIATSIHGCSDTSCVTVFIEPPCKTGVALDCPNAFSPNGDNKNDEFCIYGWDDCVENFSVYIFDRWGESVFKSNAPDFCWDGTYKGKQLEPQVLVYYITAKYIGQESKISKTGNITLIR